MNLGVCLFVAEGYSSVRWTVIALETSHNTSKEQCPKAPSNFNVINFNSSTWKQSLAGLCAINCDTTQRFSQTATQIQEISSINQGTQYLACCQLRLEPGTKTRITDLCSEMGSEEKAEYPCSAVTPKLFGLWPFKVSIYVRPFITSYTINVVMSWEQQLAKY